MDGYSILKTSKKSLVVNYLFFEGVNAMKIQLHEKYSMFKSFFAPFYAKDIV